MSLFETGVRPAIDAYLKAKSEEVRDYGDYWSASSAGYCMRLNIMRRLKIPKVPELADNAALTRVFESGHIFHEWIQRITKANGLSIAQELELQDEELMIRGHIDDLVLIDRSEFAENIPTKMGKISGEIIDQRLILYDYKTQNSMAFTWQKGRPMSYYHKMQLGTYMYMIRTLQKEEVKPAKLDNLPELTEARIMKISKDDLRMTEDHIFWNDKLEKEVLDYWTTLNRYWAYNQTDGSLPRCTCLEQEGGFMGKRSSKGKAYNDYFYEDEPCSQVWYELNKVKE